MNKLSKQNYDKLNEMFLYEYPPVIDNSFSVGTTSGTYHCKNWTFRVHKREGRAWMSDTYFGDKSREVDNDNVKKYKKIFDFREVVRVPDSSKDEYEEKDLYYVATGSGGYSCGNLHWKKKNTPKSKKLLTEKKAEKIKEYKYKIGWLEQDLKKIENNEWYEPLKEAK